MRGDAAREGFTLCDGKVGLRFRSGNKVIRGVPNCSASKDASPDTSGSLLFVRSNRTRGRTGEASVHRLCGWVVEPLAMAGYSGIVYLFNNRYTMPLSGQAD